MQWEAEEVRLRLRTQEAVEASPWSLREAVELEALPRLRVLQAVACCHRRIRRRLPPAALAERK
jgi:hypothetical protein